MCAKKFFAFCLLGVVWLSSGPQALSQSTLDTIGVTQLRALDPTLTGAGVIVAQPEAETGTNAFEVRPSATGQPAALFTYINTSGTVTGAAPPNAAGVESSHADNVGDIFYGKLNAASPEGVAPGVSGVYNYDANYFINNVVAHGAPIPAQVVNQSFVDTNTSDAVFLDQAYDNYISYYGTTIVSAVGNGGAVLSPGSAYNVISVAAYGGTSSVGPTQYDTAGRSKPDITAPGSATSYSTPLVSGAAAILTQAGQRGDGGSDPLTEAEATDSRTIKALLMNGAVKPAGWTHTETAPLDTRYGAGVLNVYDSYETLAGGKQGFSVATTSQAPPTPVGNIGTLNGWDFNSLASTASLGAGNHYFFDLTPAQGSLFDLTTTLVWNRDFDQSGINNLDLYLYNVTTGSLVDASLSTVDNVQELTDIYLPPDEYDLEVFKPTGTVGTAGTVSDGETYALAFDFTAVPEPESWAALAAGLFAIGWLLLTRPVDKK